MILLPFLVLALRVSSQDLMDVYEKGIVKLVPDTEYALNNDWEKVFSTYYDTLSGKPMGNRKSIVLMPDGSVVVNHAYKNYYSLFNPDGRFVKEFGLIKGQGWRFKDTESIRGVIDGTFFTKPNNNGKMLCFDFEGNYVKTLTLDYMTKGMVSLPNNKIAVVGWAIWETKFRDFIAIVDYENNEQKIIWELFTERCDPDQHCKLFNYTYKFEKGGMIGFNSMPYDNSYGISAPPQISNVKDKLIVALPTTGEILIFNLEGVQLSKDKIDWAKNYLSVEEQKEIQEEAIVKYKNMDPSFYAPRISSAEFEMAKESMVKQMVDDVDKISDPVPIPVFSIVIKDSDGNLLFFEFPKEEGGNKFNVWIYKDNGSFICQSSFVSDQYDLVINPAKMVFHNGYIYGLQTLKETMGNPLRLVRFKVTSN